ncbi:hypothetical protein ACJX0J_019586 [Zea mays]
MAMQKPSSYCAIWKLGSMIDELVEYVPHNMKLTKNANEMVFGLCLNRCFINLENNTLAHVCCSLIIWHMFCMRAFTLHFEYTYKNFIALNLIWFSRSTILPIWQPDCFIIVNYLFFFMILFEHLVHIMVTLINKISVHMVDRCTYDRLADFNYGSNAQDRYDLHHNKQ